MPCWLISVMMSKIWRHELGRQAHRRLVEQQHLGPGHQRPADGQHLLLAARQRAARLLAPLRQAGEEREDPVEVVGAASARRPCGRRRPSPGSPCTRHAREDAAGPRAPGRCPRSTSWWAGTPTMSSPVEPDACPTSPGRRPEMVLSVVVLPAPLPPMRVTISPSSTVQRDALEGLDLAVVDVDVVELKQHRVLRRRPGRPR